MRWWIGPQQRRGVGGEDGAAVEQAVVGQTVAAPEAGEGEWRARGQGDEEGARGPGADLLPFVEACSRDQAATLFEAVAKHWLRGCGLGADVDLAGGVVAPPSSRVRAGPSERTRPRGRRPGPSRTIGYLAVRSDVPALPPGPRAGRSAKACWNCRGSIESAKRPHMSGTDMEEGVTRQSLAAPCFSSIAWRLLETTTSPHIPTRQHQQWHADSGYMVGRPAEDVLNLGSNRLDGSICIQPVPADRALVDRILLATHHRCIGIRSVPAPALDAGKESCDRRPQPATEEWHALLTARPPLWPTAARRGHRRRRRSTEWPAAEAGRGAPRRWWRRRGRRLRACRPRAAGDRWGRGRTAPCG